MLGFVDGKLCNVKSNWISKPFRVSMVCISSFGNKVVNFGGNGGGGEGGGEGEEGGGDGGPTYITFCTVASAQTQFGKNVAQ